MAELPRAWYSYNEEQSHALQRGCRTGDCVPQQAIPPEKVMNSQRSHVWAAEGGQGNFFTLTSGDKALGRRQKTVPQTQVIIAVGKGGRMKVRGG